MSEYYNNKFRVATTRLQHWDYSSGGFYYATICTKDKSCCLGEIKDGEVYLSETGNVVFAEWLKTAKLRSYIELDDFIIMPNHFHGIMVINDFGHPQGRDMARHVSTERKFGKLQPKSLSSIIGSFKSAVTNKCHKNNLDFQWQANYYEHIITDDADLARIKKYIAHNPANWESDRNNPKYFSK